jgi:hypothetical protein
VSQSKPGYRGGTLTSLVQRYVNVRKFLNLSVPMVRHSGYGEN